MTGSPTRWASSAISADYAVIVGQPVGLMYGYQTDGFYTTADFKGYDTATKTWILKEGVANDAGVIGTAVSPGQLKLKNTNGGDNVVNEADRTVIGNANPKNTGGLNQQFSYKGFDASIFMNWSYGNDVWNDNKIEYTTYLANSQFANGLAIMNGRISGRYRTIDLKTGQAITDVGQLDALNQNATIWAAPRQLIPHSWAVEDASYLRLSNITVGYSLPRAIIQRAKLSQFRLYATVNNIYTWTKYTGFDPEVGSRGVDLGIYPQARVFLAGLNLGF